MWLSHRVGVLSAWVGVMLPGCPLAVAAVSPAAPCRHCLPGKGDRGSVGEGCQGNGVLLMHRGVTPPILLTAAHPRRARVAMSRASSWGGAARLQPSTHSRRRAVPVAEP